MAIKREADQLGKSVTLVEGTFGRNVHVHASGESPDEGNWWAVLVHLPDHCCCKDLRWTTLKPARLQTYVPSVKSLAQRFEQLRKPTA